MNDLSSLKHISGSEFAERRCVRAIVAAVMLLLSPAQLLAQAAPPAAPAVTVGRNLTLEFIIVVVMIGLALFAVCRGSRRN